MLQKPTILLCNSLSLMVLFAGDLPAGPCPCDADLAPPGGNGVIDFEDLLVVLDCLGGVFPPAGPGVCDIDCDADIDVCDLGEALNQYAGTPGPPVIGCGYVHGDIFPPGGDGIVDLGDILCVLNDFGGLCAGLDNVADIEPCPLGDNDVDLSDILEVLDGFTGDDCC